MITREMRQTLAELELVSYGTITKYNPSGGHSADEAALPPGGDLRPLHEIYRDALLKAETEEARARIHAEARNALEHERHSHSTGRGLSDDELLAARILDKKGFTPEEVADYLDTTPARVRKIRTANRRDSETGNWRTFTRAPHAADLADQGMTERQIAMILRTSRTTVRRSLGRAA